MLSYLAIFQTSEVLSFSVPAAKNWGKMVGINIGRCVDKHQNGSLHSKICLGVYKSFICANVYLAEEAYHNAKA
jgi:hypothetical protein